MLVINNYHWRHLSTRVPETNSQVRFSFNIWCGTSFEFSYTVFSYSHVPNKIVMDYHLCIYIVYLYTGSQIL